MEPPSPQSLDEPLTPEIAKEIQRYSSFGDYEEALKSEITQKSSEIGTLRKEIGI